MTYQTGIVLSGGAARGFAHLGALKALNEASIYPDIISGVSAGSIVGAFYADGYSPDEIFDIFSQRKFIKYLELAVPKRGLLKMKGLQKIMKKYLRARRFDELKTPMFIAIAELYEGRILYLNHGELIPAIIASCSIPVVFDPIESDHFLFVDGGILDNLPVKPLLDNCTHLIGVNVNPLGRIDKLNGLLNLIERTFLVMNAKDISQKKDLFDLYIEPAELQGFSYVDITKGKIMFHIGYEETNKVLVSSGFAPSVHG
jgi:NTE family protein